MSKKAAIFVLIAVFAVLIGIFAFDARLKTVFCEVNSEGKADPCRIVFISDLHSDKYGEGMEELLSTVYAQNPDFVLFGGDVFDDKKNWDNSLIVLEALSKEFPCFYAPGNHEIRSGRLDEVRETVSGLGITVLGEGDVFSAGGINFYGIDGKSDFTRLARAKANAPNGFDVLLAHWPEDAGSFAKLRFDLVLSGHAHGGQWRLPFFQNGLYAPGQGFFPKYSGGCFDIGETTLIVSRGLARESTPIPRIFNRPELVVIDIV